MTQLIPRNKYEYFTLTNKRSKNTYRYSMYLHYEIRPGEAVYSLGTRYNIPEGMVGLTLGYSTMLHKARICIPDIHRKLLPETIMCQQNLYSTVYYAYSHKEIFDFIKLLVNEYGRYTIEGDFIDVNQINYLQLLAS